MSQGDIMLLTLIFKINYFLIVYFYFAVSFSNNLRSILPNTYPWCLLFIFKNGLQNMNDIGFINNSGLWVLSGSDFRNLAKTLRSPSFTTVFDYPSQRRISPVITMFVHIKIIKSNGKFWIWRVELDTMTDLCNNRNIVFFSINTPDNIYLLLIST